MKYTVLSATIILIYTHSLLGINRTHYDFVNPFVKQNYSDNYSLSDLSKEDINQDENGTDNFIFQETALSFIYLGKDFTIPIRLKRSLDERHNLVTKINSSGYRWYDMITNIPKDNYFFLKDIFKIKEIPVFYGLTLLSGTLSMADESGWKFNHKLYVDNKLFHKTSDIAVFMGDGTFDCILSGAFASYGLLDHNELALKTAGNIIESLLSAGLFVQVLKRMTGRESPAASDWSPGDFKFFPSIKEYQKQESKYYSFPSGHLASATAALTVIANNYPNIKWLKPVGYSFLGLLGFSLVGKGMHWYSDLPLGFFIGYTFGNIIAPVQTKVVNTKKSNAHLSIMPAVGYNQIGINLSYNF